LIFRRKVLIISKREKGTYMRSIIFIGSQKSGSSREAIRAAEDLGYFTILFTNRQTHLDQRIEFPDVHEMIVINLNDKEAMREKIKQLQVQGKIIEAIVSFVEYVHTATVLCEEFCYKKLPTKSIFIMEDKIQTRIALQNSEFNINYDIYKGEETLDSFIEEHKLSYPVIVKAPRSTGSKDVIKANDKAELKNHIEKLRTKHPQTYILLEEYIDSPQYLVEVLVTDNEINIVTIIEQEILEKQCFIVTGYSLLAQVENELYNEIFYVVRSIIDTLEFKSGSCHLELRRHNNQWKLIEINPRISGGAMNKMIEIAYGINFVKQIIKELIGEKPSLEKKYEQSVFVQYITLSNKGILQKVTGKKRISRYKGVYDVYIRPRKGTYLQPPLSMGHRYGYVLTAASNLEEAREVAKNAAKEIKFYLDSYGKESI
jgi:biotin carboxylase